MIFEVNPEQIQSLDSLMLVKLMKRLMHAECRLTGIPLSSATVPLQITVPDGGEDGRVQWEGGCSHTDFFPDRLCIFQSKAQNLSPSDLSKEIYRTKGKPESGLNAAILDVLQNNGAYIVFCSHPFTGQKIEGLRSAVENAIHSLDINFSCAKAIEIYDANKISDWITTHPSVALWLKEIIDGFSTNAIHSFEDWGKESIISDVAWIADDNPRFFVSDSTADINQELTFDETEKSILMHLQDAGSVVRISGASGFGKTRFCYELFQETERHKKLKEIEKSSLLYVDYSIEGDSILKLASWLAKSASHELIIVDECPDEIHTKLKNIVQRIDSDLRLITIDVETKLKISQRTLFVKLLPGEEEFISKIAKAIRPDLSEQNLRFIQKLSKGFPRMAVIAAMYGADGNLLIESTAELKSKIVRGNSSLIDEEAERSLEVASLFERVGISGSEIAQAIFVAQNLTPLSPETFIEHLKTFKARGIALERGDFIQVHLIPLAALLGRQRLDLWPSGKLAEVFVSMPTALQTSLLRRLRWLDTHPETQNFARVLLAGNRLGNFDTLNTVRGSEYLDSLVHIAPDLVISTIQEVFGNLSLDELAKFDKGRQHLIWALDKLAFRKQSFLSAATLLRKLSAVSEPSIYEDTANSHFQRFYQLLLSGTEAEPDLKLLVLDEGLTSSDEREQHVCIEALDKMLQTGNFSRWGGNDEIGSSRLKDWYPATFGEVFSYHREGLQRLVDIAISTSLFAQRARDIISSHIRGLIRVLSFEDIQTAIDTIQEQCGFWPDALYAIDHWLYFDSNKEVKEEHQEAANELSNKVRLYFNSLMPTDPSRLIELYTHDWQGKFYNPDTWYQQESPNGKDYEYSTRQLKQLAEVIVDDKETTLKIVKKLAVSNAKNCFYFARRLAELSPDAGRFFMEVLEETVSSEENPNHQLFKGLLSGIDNLDFEQARMIIDKALETEVFCNYAIELISSVTLRPQDVPYIVSLLERGLITPQQCVRISYGRGIQHLSDSDLEPLFTYLTSNGVLGLWASLEMIFFAIPDKTEPSVLQVNLIQSILLAPELFECQSSDDMSDHYFEEGIKLLLKYEKADQNFISALIRQLYSICNEDKAHIFNDWYRLTKKLLNLLVQNHPELIWHQTVNLMSDSAGIDLYSVEELLVSDGDGYLFEGGLLYKIPEQTYLNWVRENPDERASIVTKWLPIAIKGEDGILAWHPDLESFISEFHSRRNVLPVLETRLYPNSFVWGPGSPHLQPMLQLLEIWSKHPVLRLRQWAHQQTIQIRQKMEHFDKMHSQLWNNDI